MTLDLEAIRRRVERDDDRLEREAFSNDKVIAAWVHAHQDCAALLAEVERLRETLSRAEGAIERALACGQREKAMDALQAIRTALEVAGE